MDFKSQLEQMDSATKDVARERIFEKIREGMLERAKTPDQLSQLAIRLYGVETPPLGFRTPKTLLAYRSFPPSPTIRRRTPIPEQPPLALTDQFASDPAKTVQWKAFLRRVGLENETVPEHPSNLAISGRKEAVWLADQVERSV